MDEAIKVVLRKVEKGNGYEILGKSQVLFWNDGDCSNYYHKAWLTPPFQRIS